MLALFLYLGSGVVSDLPLFSLLFPSLLRSGFGRCSALSKQFPFESLAFAILLEDIAEYEITHTPCRAKGGNITPLHAAVWYGDE